ncbi:MAG TPA: surface-adhesin E family protein [Gemmatimonadaceae bacterium]|nr:surface-adhesin E family protein [Gemmatimonadaceae bacterium]
MHSKLIPALLAVAVLAVSAGAQKAPRHTTAKTRTSSSGPSGAWRSVYNDATVRVALDTTQTKRAPDGTYRVRLRWQYTTNQMIGTRHAYRTMVDRKMIDCTTQGIKPVSAQTYDVNGKPVAGYDTPDSQLVQIDWAKRPPGSSAGKAYAAVCGAIRK